MIFKRDWMGRIRKSTEEAPAREKVKESRPLTPIVRSGLIAAARNCVVSAKGLTDQVPDFPMDGFRENGSYACVAAGRNVVYALKDGRIRVYGDRTELNGDEYFGSASDAFVRRAESLDSVTSIGADEGTIACVYGEGAIFGNVPGAEALGKFGKVVQAGAIWKEVFALYEDGTLKTTSSYLSPAIGDWAELVQFHVSGPYYCTPCLIGLKKDGTVRFCVGNQNVEDPILAGWNNVVQVSCCNYRAMALCADGSICWYSRGQAERIDRCGDILAVCCQFDGDYGLRKDGSILQFPFAYRWQEAR